MDRRSKAMKTGCMKFSLVMVVLLLGGVSFNLHASEEYSPPVSIQKNIFTYTVRQDGSYQEVAEVSTLIENEEGVSGYGEDKISYTPSQESIKILDAYTILPNGTRITQLPEKPLPITRIIVGPHRNQDNRQHAVKILLGQYDLNIPVSVSEIPYIGHS